MKKNGLFFVLLLILTVGTAFGQVFQNGDRVCFLGDSITHGGMYHNYINVYYATRFPDRDIKIFSAGISGGSASWAMSWIDEDVIAKKPNKIAIMFGMNDVGRGNYTANPTAAQRKGQERAFQNYKSNMAILLAALKKGTTASYIFITPSPFDQTGVNDKNNNQPGCNDGLGRCAGFVKELAAENNGLLVDFHAPMTALNVKEQKKDPQYTLIGADRVHPKGPGHTMMAYLFLKAQGAPALVSNLELDAQNAKVIKCENASVSNLKKEKDAIAFDLLEKALPYPVLPDARPILDLIPFTKDLNQETFSIKNLGKDSAELVIDGISIGKFSKEEFEKGINLALNEKTPQYQQAMQVGKLGEQRRGIEGSLRSLVFTRLYLKGKKVNPDDLKEVAEYLEKKFNVNVPAGGYYKGQIIAYLKNWEKRDEIRASFDKIEEEIRSAAAPVVHHYSVK